MARTPADTAGRPRPRVADTSFLYAAWDESDRHHEAALRELALVGPLVVPAEVLVETLGLTLHRAGRDAARNVREDLRGLPHVELTHPTDLHETLMIQQEHPGLSVVDAAVVWHCRRLGCRAATFDGRILALVPA